MEERKRGGASGFDASEAEEREIRLEQARTARIEAEERSRKKESRRASRKALGRFAKRFPLKVTVTIAVGLLVALIAIFGFVLPYVMDDDENQYVTESDLKSAVDIDNLSTIDYVYHGIAEKHSTFLWQDRVDYRVKYQAHVRASYKLVDIEFRVDRDKGVATAYLPEAEIGEPQLDHKEFGYLPENATADMKDVIALCREDAASDVDRDEIRREADASLQDTVSALTKYLLGDDLKLEFKPISEYSEEVAADE